MSYFLAGAFCIYTVCLMQYTRGLVSYIRKKHPEFIMVRHPDVFENMARPCFWFINCRICLDLYILRGWSGIDDHELRRKVNRFYAIALPCIALGVLFVVAAFTSLRVKEFVP